jgi:hypothetical protein
MVCKVFMGTERIDKKGSRLVRLSSKGVGGIMTPVRKKGGMKGGGGKSR